MKNYAYDGKVSDDCDCNETSPSSLLLTFAVKFDAWLMEQAEAGAQFVPESRGSPRAQRDGKVVGASR